MQPSAQQKQNLEEAIRLLRDFASDCPVLAEILTGIADSNDRLISRERALVETPGSGGILEGGEFAKTSIDYSFFRGRYFVTTFSTGLFPGRTLDRSRCSDISAVTRLMSTATHETYHRRCDKDPDVYILNIGLLRAIKSCVSRDRPCYAEIIAALEDEIMNETSALSSGGSGNEALKTALAAGGVGLLAGALAIRAGITAAIVGGAKTAGVVGSAGGPAGLAVGVAIGVVVGVATYFYVNACE